MMTSALKDTLYNRVPLSVLRQVLPLVAASKSPFLPTILEREVIFVHVPKAAGSSLKELLYGARMGGHRSIAEFAAYDAAKTGAFFKCAFVRNPWDRMLSAYSYLVQGRDSSRRDKAFAQEYLAPFSDFNKFVSALEGPRLRAQVMRYDHFRPQTHWICLPGQADHMMDFLGRFESMSDDLTQLCEILDLPPPELKSSRTSQHKPYQDEYDAQSRETVARLYAADIALLNYRF